MVRAWGPVVRSAAQLWAVLPASGRNPTGRRLNTALKEDQLIAQNPCLIPGYDKETSTERSVATIRQVFALSQLVERRYAALVLLAAFTGLRWGELVALRRSDLDLERRTVTVSRKFAERQDGRRVTGPPKSTAGVRVVALPAMLVDVMKAHLLDFPAEGEELVFRGPLGASLRRNNFHRSVRWTKIVVEAGLPAGFHFHDLRHTGNKSGGGERRQHSGADVPNGPRQHARRPDLPACDESAGSRDR